MSRAAALALVLLALAFAPLAPAGHLPPCTNTTPVNDCVANATDIPPYDRWAGMLHLRASNVGATTEPYEDLPGGGAATVWWKFTAFRASGGSFSVRHSDHQAFVATYELQDDGSLRFLDWASGWSSFSWAGVECEAGRTYYVQAGGEEEQWGTLDLWGTTCQLAPERPREASVRAVPGTERGDVDVTWTLADDGGAPVTAWTLEQATAPCTTWSPAATLEGSAASYTASGLPEGVVHCFRVAATNEAGTGPTAMAAAAPRGIPGAPGLIGARAASASALTVSWWAPTFDGGSPVLGYRVQGADQADGPWTLLGETTERTWQEEGLAPGTTRHYRVSATTALGEGPAKATSARTWAPPSAPRDVATRIAFPNPLQVEVVWKAPADTGGRAVLDYTVLRGPKGGELQPIATVPASATSFVDSPSPLRAFDYAVQARNAVGASPISTRACGEVLPTPSSLGGC